MIIWINGPFGAGKTTLAKRLRDRRSKSLIFDPEEIGFVVKETVPMPASGDYQDLPLWRGLTIAAVRTEMPRLRCCPRLPGDAHRGNG